jgi:hypothetical protein
MAKHAITEFDMFYLSYDEPQKEEFWAKLQELAPWAKRVDGVKGFDTAHKECAKQSETDKFITVDGDNLVYPEFFDLEIDIPAKFDDCTLSWSGRNIINGLHYGNGGLKLWTRDFVMNMKAHEGSEGNHKVDFCWDSKYIQLNNTYSDTCPNGSPFQAFRAGFREGVKMTLDRGEKAKSKIIHKHVHSKNYKRLLIWATIGDDVENGQWSIYGTRLGIYSANIAPVFDISNISDYDWFKDYFNSEIADRDPWDEATKLLDPLQKTLAMNIADMLPSQSRFFKSVYESPRRNDNPVLTEIEADQK